MRGTNALIPHAMPSTLTSRHQRQSWGSYSQSWVWPPGPMPRVVAEHVHATELVHRLLGEMLDRLGLGDVRDAPGHVQPVGPQPGDRLVERVGLDVRQHHLHSLLGEVAAHGEPDAVRTAGDDCDLALDVPHGARLPTHDSLIGGTR